MGLQYCVNVFVFLQLLWHLTIIGLLWFVRVVVLVSIGFRWQCYEALARCYECDRQSHQQLVYFSPLLKDNVHQVVFIFYPPITPLWSRVLQFCVLDCNLLREKRQTHNLEYKIEILIRLIYVSLSVYLFHAIPIDIFKNRIRYTYIVSSTNPAKIYL